MKNFLMQWIIVLILIPAFSSAEDANTIENQYIDKMAAVFSYVDSGAVWPDFNMKEMPIFFYFQSKHVYAFNFNPLRPELKATHWVPVIADDKSTPYSSAIYLQEKDENGLDQVSTYKKYDFPTMPPHGSLCVVTGIYNPFAFRDLYEQDSFVLRVLNNGPHQTISGQDDITRTIKQIFHHNYLEKKLAWVKTYNQSSPGNMHDIANVATNNNVLYNITFIYLQVEKLRKYLIDNDEEALIDYVAIYLYRHEILNWRDGAYELAKEDSIGLSSYVGLKSQQLADDIYKKKVIQKIGKCTSATLEFSPDDGSSQCLEHDYFEFTGAGVGYALDKLSKDDGWKKLVADSNVSSASSFNDQLVKVIIAKKSLTYDQLIARVEQLKSSEAYNRIFKDILNRA